MEDFLRFSPWNGGLGLSLALTSPSRSAHGQVFRGLGAAPLRNIFGSFVAHYESCAQKMCFVD